MFLGWLIVLLVVGEGGGYGIVDVEDPADLHADRVVFPDDDGSSGELSCSTFTFHTENALHIQYVPVIRSHISHI